MAPKPTIELMIADDHAIFRRGIKSFLHSFQKNKFVLVGEAANGRDVVRAVADYQPHLVLMDVQMPGMNGIEATLRIKEQHPGVRILALSYAADGEHVLAMVRAGADGFLLKDTPPEELCEAIHTVHGGLSYFTPLASSYLTAALKAEQKAAASPTCQLTKRESQILGLICEGKSSREIATELFVSKRTVDTFREKLMWKAGVKNTLQLLRYAIKERLVSV